MLSINSKNINDSKFHDIQLFRNEQSVKLLVDGMFVNRTISPGSEATLDILSEHFYVGARINIRNDSMSNGFKGCVVGLRLDRKEVPVGGENTHFTTLKILNGIQSHCPIGLLKISEAPQSRTNVYVGIGVTLAAVTYIIAFIIITTFILVKFRRDRHRLHTLNLRNHEGSRESQDCRSPQSKNQLLSFHTSDTNPTGTFELATPGKESSGNPTAETAFYTNASVCERTDSVSSSERNYYLPSSKEDLSAVS